MKVALIGASGFTGKAIQQELTNRGVNVIAIARNPVNITDAAGVTKRPANVNDVAALAEAVAGADVVINAFNAGWTNPNLYQDYLAGAKAIQQASVRAGVSRLIVIGGAGTLQIDGKQLVDGPDFPAEYKAGATAVRDYFNHLKTETGTDWVFFSPAIEMHPGITTGRTGNFRLGGTTPVFDTNGRSVLSVEDLAVVIADEVVEPKHHRAQFTAAY
ncbi:NAD(P)-dependent oxidoreductase [Pedobacter sp. SYP-B3415]|uniref:NAD(P)-dependent oxidoreductase n=1 Tax=Pedobacter sp. SYP-B3415 TaxID=2496641 RepID=UPI00101D54FF|nr:NAD(P)H-binding protein [Pedobacter sp. SYP-B3415]